MLHDTDMTDLKSKLLCLLPMTLGLYCLIQGALLASSPNPSIVMLAFGLWLWVPGCAYFTWRGRKAFAARTAPVRATVEAAHTVEEDGDLAIAVD